MSVVLHTVCLHTAAMAVLLHTAAMAVLLHTAAMAVLLHTVCWRTVDVWAHWCYERCAAYCLFVRCCYGRLVAYCLFAHCRCVGALVL